MGDTKNPCMTTTLKIKTLYLDLEDKLGLDWICGKQHKQRLIHTSKDEAADISLVGQMNLINPHLIQVLGSKELKYLENLKKNSRKDAIAQLFSGSSKLIIIATPQDIPPDRITSYNVCYTKLLRNSQRQAGLARSQAEPASVRMHSGQAAGYRVVFRVWSYNFV